MLFLVCGAGKAIMHAKWRTAAVMAGTLVAFLLPGALGDGVAVRHDGQANDCQEASEFKCCGDIRLVFRNPDLTPEDDGFVHAHGQFFAQFQAIGAAADDITFFGFSFSTVGQEADENVCQQEPWAPSGAYIINYRADTDPDDGFFINLQTTLVPDGQYMAAVHAYNDADEEIARAWTLAVVDNCDGGEGTRCDSDDYPTEEHVRQDQTMPWPIMLPGDGELDTSKNNAPDEATLTLEFAEPLSELRVFLNGLLIHDKNGSPQNMTEFDGRNWDDDLIPGYGPYGLGGLVAPECSQQPPQTCNPLGEAWYWAGRTLTDADVMRVEATDLAGNVAKKEIHIGTGQGGAITDDLPRLQITAREITKTVAAGESAVFQFDMVNTGGTTAHPFTDFDDPIVEGTGQAAEGTWDVGWRPHEPVDPGEEKTQEFTVRPGNDVPSGIYQVNGTISWEEGTEQKDRTWDLTVNVGGVSGNTQQNGTGEEEGDGGGKDSPAPSLVLVAGAFAAVAAFRARRRR